MSGGLDRILEGVAGSEFVRPGRSKQRAAGWLRRFA